MMTYLLRNRHKVVKVQNHEQLVSWMRTHDYQYWNNNNDFMKEYALRKQIFEEIKLRTDNETVFIKDMIENNILSVIQTESYWDTIKNNFRMMRRRQLFGSLIRYRRANL